MAGFAFVSTRDAWTTKCNHKIARSASWDKLFEYSFIQKSMYNNFLLPQSAYDT